MSHSYNIQDYKKVPAILNWLGGGLKLIKTFNDEDQEKCKTSFKLFEVMSKTFKPPHNETILPLPNCKLIRDQRENAEEEMGYHKMRANECKHNEKVEG